MATLVTESGRKTPARLAGSAVLACQSDERLARLVHEGHDGAFEAIVHRYRRPLLRYCSQILPESRTEDAVQQAFINAHAALQSGDAPLQLKAWLYTITRNAALNMLRQNGWNYEQIPVDFDGVRRPDQVFEQRIELQQTVAALNALPERQRDALVMREFEGRSYDEIALALSANDGAVRQLLNRARGTLRNAASLVMPPPLVARAAASIPPSDGRRLGEVFGGLGAAGVAKAGATALVAGSLVVGVVNAPLPLGESQKTTRQKATLAAGEPVARHTHKARDIEVATRTPALRSPLGQRAHGAPAAGHRHSGITHHGEGERHQPAERRERSGGGTDGRSGGSNDRGTRDTSGSSGSPSTSGGSGSDGHSGTSGSDDVATTLVGSSGSGGSSDTSGTSGGSGTSGSSGSSGSDDFITSGTSGTSGSDSSGSGTTTSTSTSTSGKDGSSTSGSGSSGSSSSSGSSDPLEH